MSAQGGLLGDIAGLPKFIEFNRSSGGMVYIRNPQNPDKYLAADKSGICFFGKQKRALKFEAKILLHNEAIIFEEYPTTKALGIITVGSRTYCECLQSYWHIRQDWFIMDPFYLTADRLPLVSELQHLVAVSDTDAAARRQLIIHFCESGKSSEEIADILVLLYGSMSPRENLDLNDQAMLAERRQQILKLVGSGMSTKEVGEVLKLLYGTATVKAGHEDEEVEVESEAQYVCVSHQKS